MVRYASVNAPRRMWTVLGLALIVMTHHQAAAQVTATKPSTSGSAAATPAVTTTAASSTPAAKPAASATPAAAVTDAAVWKQMGDSLQKVIADTFGSRPLSSSDMVQAAGDWLRNAGSGQVLSGAGAAGAGVGSGAVGGNLREAVSNSQLVDAFDQLRQTARNVGLSLPSNSPALDTWSRLGDALRSGPSGRADFTAVLPVLMNNSMAQAAGMGQVSDPITAFINLPANVRIALATLTNLGLDAFLNGPGAVLALTSLGIGLAASICGIVGGAFFIAGASVLLGAGVDSLDPAKVKEYKDNKYIQEFQQLAAQSQATILPASLNKRNVQLVDMAAQVLNVTIGFVDRQNKGQIGQNLGQNMGNNWGQDIVNSFAQSIGNLGTNFGANLG